MRMHFAVALGALSLFSGCAIHPVPEDVAGVNTYHIVRQIRCETREALRTIVTEWLAGRAAASGDPLLQRLALQYERDPASINTFHYDLFKGPQYVQIRSIVKLFYDTGIAYNFDLTMVENNNLTADVNFLKAFTEPVFTLGLNAGSSRRRSNERVFTTTDTISYLLTQVPETYCVNQVVQTANYAYPITGRIGVDKTIKTFIELTLFGALGDGKGPPTMVDKLSFTTALSASATPRIVFTPITNILTPVNAQLNAVADRTDTHSVFVALAIAGVGVGEVDTTRSFLFSATDRAAPVRRPGAVTSGLVVGTRVTAGGTPAERLAVIAIDQIKSREVQFVPAQ